MPSRVLTDAASTVAAVTPILFILLAASPASAASCESLAALKLPNATLRLATLVPKGGFVPPPEASEHGIRTTKFDDLPAFCRVAASLTPSTDSNVMFEAWLPTVRTRPLCAYPQVATYKGSGSPDEAASFVCR